MIKIFQERVFYMNTYVHLLQYLDAFFLALQMLQIKDVLKLKRHILCSVSNVGRNGRARQVRDANIIRRRKDSICVPDN